MIADLTRGSGRFNVVQGLISVCFGTGYALGNLLAGFVAQKAGYSVGFIMLAVIAAGA